MVSFHIKLDPPRLNKTSSRFMLLLLLKYCVIRCPKNCVAADLFTLHFILRVFIGNRREWDETQKVSLLYVIVNFFGPDHA